MWCLIVNAELLEGEGGRDATNPHHLVVQHCLVDGAAAGRPLAQHSEHRLVDVTTDSSPFEIRAQEAEAKAVELGHSLQAWSRGTDRAGADKWLAACEACGSLAMVEYSHDYPIMSGGAVKISCESAQHNSARERERRAQRLG
jgi:hypothetical protein